ncbi:MAG TPA: aspartate/glutamate racemase family protein [Vineibacter sp.]|nr:aspartate/glutamate racemase family protein [Vineibacter sp.]
MRLLLINPNTTAAITDKVVAMAHTVVAPTTELVAVTGRFGAAYVASRAAYAIAAHAALDAWAETPGPFDAVVLACFGDPGLDALRELAPVPVVGMAEASIQTACQLGGRFGIVTGGERWAPMLREFVAARGLADRLACVHTVAPTGADIARDPDGSLSVLATACAHAVDGGADTVILGGAGLAGLAARLAHRVPVPLIDGVAAAIGQAEALARLGTGKGRTGSFALPPPVDSIGLSIGLATRLAGRTGS